jgi:hypothetical protein
VLDIAQENWISCKIPVSLMRSIDEFLKTDVAKRNNVFSRTDFISRVSALWFSIYEKDLKLFMENQKFKDTFTKKNASV